MWKVEIAFWYIILSFKLKTSYFCQIGAVIQTYCHTVCKANHMSTCKLLIVQTRRNVWMYAFFLKHVQKTSHPEVKLLDPVQTCATCIPVMLPIISHAPTVVHEFTHVCLEKLKG